MEKAINEDPNTFSYDEVYSDLQTNRQKQEEAQQQDRSERKAWNEIISVLIGWTNSKFDLDFSCILVF